MGVVKKLSTAMLAVLMLLSFAACGDGQNDKDEDSKEEVSLIYYDKSKAESGEKSFADVGETSEKGSESSEPESTRLNYEYMKGIWLYQYSSESLFRNNGVQRDEADYTALVEKICSNLERDGFNTLFLQVRGHGDSFYPSELYPPSRYCVADYDSVFIYDPLEIFTEIAHKHGISLHAWLNPYRLLTEKQMQDVPDSYKIKQWYNEKRGDYIIALDGRYYANPAYAEVQQLVIDGAVEICRNYNIDGIHIDDYFYPSGVTDSFDYIAYADLGAGRTLKQFRYDSVNSLVKGLYDAIHAVDPDLKFGISPAGNMSNNRGYLSADIDTWCTTSGYIDYIAPQVYWSFDYYRDFAKFDICSENWGDLVTCEDVDLVIGMGLYRTVNAEYSESDPGWYLYKDNVKRMLEFTYDYEKASGFIMFDYCSMYDVFTGEYRSEINEERENFLPLLKG